MTDSAAEEPTTTDSVKKAARQVDRNKLLVAAVRKLRERLPGDSSFGDPLSTSGTRQAALMGRGMRMLTSDRPGALREAGFGILQVWQAMTEASSMSKAAKWQGPVTLAFTDLVEFSDWALDAGDDATLALLRDVARALEPPVNKHGGIVVKWLGDGMMAAFDDAQHAFDAIREGIERCRAVQAPGYRMRLRAGLHTGHPRQLGGDYLGVDVNIAARVLEKSAAGEILVTDTTAARLDTSRVKLRKRRRLLPVKGMPEELQLFSVTTP